MSTRDRFGSAVGVPRRSVLRTSVVAAGCALAGCLGDEDDPVPDPVSIEDDHDCAVCNMVITNHPGPSGHSFYPDDGDVPDADDDDIVYYCSSLCAYEHRFEGEADGTEPLVQYLTDYSSVEWSVSEDDGIEFLTAHLEAAAHAPAEEMTYVVDSDVYGAMGESIVGFTSGDDADDFADQYGGDRLDHGSISRELVDSLGL